MLITLREVLSLDVVRRGLPVVVAGADRLDVPVRWVHAVEVTDDVARLLRGGELILSTGIALPESDSALASYVAELAAAGVAGLAIELGRRYSVSLPAALVAAAASSGVVLIEFRAEVAFVELTEAVHTRIFEARAQLPDQRLRGLLYQLRDDPRVRAFADRELGALVSYDAAHGTRLVGDLAVFLEAGGNKALAASRAHMARPTFYQRLRVIEAVLGVSLADAESRASLHVALLALRPGAARPRLKSHAASPGACVTLNKRRHIEGYRITLNMDGHFAAFTAFSTLFAIAARVSWSAVQQTSVSAVCWCGPRISDRNLLYRPGPSAVGTAPTRPG